MHPSLWREAWLAAFVVLAALLLGLATDRPFLAAAAVFGVYIGVSLRRLHQLQHWLRTRDNSEIPDAEGFMG